MSGQTGEHILHELDKLQLMIDVSADRLIGLRTQCEPSAELTQQEIRTVEGKLIKLFSSQLVQKEGLARCGSRARHKAENIPRLSQWLTVVGLNEAAIRSVSSKVCSLEALQERSDHELRLLLPRHSSEEDVRRLSRALHNLRRFTDVLRRDAHPDCSDQLPLYWDSWDNERTSAVPSPRLPRSHAGWHPQDGNTYNNNHVLHGESQGDGGRKEPRSPGEQLVPKSKSHEFALGPSDSNGDGHSGPSGSGGQRARLPTEPGPNCSTSLGSPLRSPPLHDSERSLPLPKSPRTPTLPRPGVMGHSIAHRFTKTFKMMTTCNLCEKQMFIGTGLKCIDCQYICHPDCERKVPASCKLPKQMLDEFVLGIVSGNHSPHASRSATISPKHKPTSRFPHSRKTSNSQPAITVPPFSQGPDSSSTSSCNSSTPSSPALVLHPVGKSTTFQYPDVDRGVTLETHPLALSKESEVGSRDSDKTVSVSGSGSFSLSTDSDRTPVRVDSQDSQVSDGEPDRGWPRQNSLSIREWDIPYDELRIGETVGRGRFGTVYRGYWHGNVAVKVLDMNYLEDEKRLDAFKLEVATFRKTRHDNIVLFMGACMKPEHFAIVTSFSKGMTLYTHIHLRHEKFYLNKNIVIAQQISQGMGYLHAKGIIHKDLKSKNIFLDGGKVVITDFGLFGVTKLCYGSRQDRDGLIIPPGWLCYLSSEMMTSLRSSYQPDEELPFSKASDVYAFGTVWYELLCGDWPFKGQPPEAIIWQVGKGMKQSLANLQASRDVKDILMMCWSYRAPDRPNFSMLLETLGKLPKKKLARSPSHPIHLSRSAESVF